MEYLVILLQTGRVRFGHGLGDIVDHGFVYLGLILSVFLLIGKENVPPKVFQILSSLLINSTVSNCTGIKLNT